MFFRENKRSPRIRFVVTLLFLSLLSMGSFTECEPQSKYPADSENAQPEPRPIPVPNPNPDTPPKNTLPKRTKAPTPNPVEADPNPSSRHVWRIYVAWLPAGSTVTIQWSIGPFDSFKREYTRGDFEVTKEVHGMVRVRVEASALKNGYQYSLSCLITRDDTKNGLPDRPDNSNAGTDKTRARVLCITQG